MNSESRRALLITGAAILLLAVLSRCLYLTYSPPGLNQDEASAGYEAWAILHYGIDRSGNTLPVLLVSWGSGQNALYSYLLMPIIALLGLNVFSVRLLAGIVGSLTVLVFALTAPDAAPGHRSDLSRRSYTAAAGGGRGAKNTRLSLFSARLTPACMLCFGVTLLSCPWHLTASRWALESNLLVACVAFAVFFAARERYIALAVTLGLSLYAYGTAFIFTPLLALFVLADAVARRRVTLRRALTAIAVFAAIAFPIALCNLRNQLGLPGMRLFGVFTLPELTQTRQTVTMSLAVAENLRRLVKLLWTQRDLPWNVMGGEMGMLWGKAGLIVSLAGVAAALLERRARHMLYALVAAVATCAFVNVNVNRANALLIPLVYFQGYAVFAAYRLLTRAATRRAAYRSGRRGSTRRATPIVPACAAVARFALIPAALLLAVTAHAALYTSWRDGLRLSFGAGQPTYIFLLFDEKISPREFSDTVVYDNPDSPFRNAVSFTYTNAKGERVRWAAK